MDDRPIGIRQLYDGLWDAASWQAGLDAVCAELKAHHLISLVYPAEKTGMDEAICWTAHVPAQQADAVVGNADWLAAVTGATPLRTAMPAEAVVPYSAFVRTEFYRSVVRPMGGHHAAFTLPFRHGFMAACRPRTAPDFTPAEFRRLQAMVPHLEATLRLKRHLLTLGTQVALLEAGLAELDVGVMIVARSGRILYANRSAEASMHDIRDVGSPFVTARRVREMIARPDGGHHVIPRGQARRPLVVRAVPLSGRGSEHLPVPPQSGVAVFLRDPEQKPRTVAVDLAVGLGLTPREASLAHLMARDLTLAEAADTLGITWENARTHLKRIFSKTNTRRQAELVSLILRLQV